MSSATEDVDLVAINVFTRIMQGVYRLLWVSMVIALSLATIIVLEPVVTAFHNISPWSILFFGPSIAIPLIVILTLSSINTWYLFVIGTTILVLLVGAVVLGAWRYIIDGVKKLTEINQKEYHTALVFTSFLVLGFCIALASIILPLQLLIFLSSISNVLGHIGVMLMCFRISMKFESVELALAGLLFTLGTIIMPIDIAGWVLMHKGLSCIVIASKKS